MKNLYLLIDGTHADPDACKSGKDGILKHENGVAVALHEDGSPHIIQQDSIENKNVMAAELVDKDKPSGLMTTENVAVPHATPISAKPVDIKPATIKGP